MKAVLLAILMMCLSSLAMAAEDGLPLHVALAGYMTLQGADLAVTMYDLGHVTASPGFQFKEANPIFAPFVQHPVVAGAFKMGVAAGTSWMLLHYHKDHPRLAFWGAVAADGFYAYVVAHNVRLSR